MSFDLTPTDRRLLAALKKDGRASVTSLAGILGVSRATIQSRLERLIQSGTIQRFTIETDAGVENDLLKAVMMIELEGTRARFVIAALKRIAEIASLHTTNGKWDLVAHVEVSSLAELDRILREVREIGGVVTSDTSILLNKAGL